MKGERVAQLELLLRSHPEGLRRAEIARRLNVHRSTISRYVEELANHIDIIEDNNLIKIKAQDDEENIALSVYESLAFNMSAEILATSADIQNPHLASGLRKIAMNMRSYAPKISDNMLVVAEKIDQEVQKNRGRNTKYSAILEVLIDAWVTGRIVKITTTNPSADEIELAPYFIGFREDSLGRNPITVTGRLRHTKEITTLDITTITSATLLDETYTIPDNLKPFKAKEKEEEFVDLIDSIPLKVKLSSKSALNAFDAVITGEKTYEKTESGELFCTFSAENSIDLMMKIFQSGVSIEIIEPVEYKEKYLAYIKKILGLYER